MAEKVCNLVKNSGGVQYSTSEEVVGTWYNGKPIYQKTFTGTTPSSGSGTFPSNSNAVNVSIGARIDEVISIEGAAAGGSGVVSPANSAVTANRYFTVWVLDDTFSTPSMANTYGVAVGSSVVSVPYQVTIKYTKV